MIKNTLILIFFLAFTFVITIYYKKSSIKLEGDRVVLNVKDKSVLFDYTLVKLETLSFSNLDIVQKELKIKGRTLLFELARADALYSFNSDTKFIVKSIFEAKKINYLFSINGLSAMELVLEDDSVVNLFVEESEGKELKFLYGFSSNSFREAVEKLGNFKTQLLYQDRLGELKKRVTHWNIKHINIDAVVESIDY
jgi:hypothetical protein